MKQKMLLLRVEIQAKVNERNPEKFERKYAELEGQHSRFQRRLDQTSRTKWKKVKERNIKNHERNNILASAGTNSLRQSYSQGWLIKLETKL